ncbi:MAG: DUF1489 family protein [Rhizobiales bacterium]|nr:DUF1489 family protein [Hyphomicrobiales bacterium]
MALHLIKLCVGADSIEDLAVWQEGREKVHREAGRVDAQGRGEIWHTTRMFPRRREEVLAGGSLYWVIKRVVQVRQRILDLRPVAGDDGIERCEIVLDHALVPVRGQPRRPFQGWRYLKGEDAPADLGAGASRSGKAIPPAMARELSELGLI